MKKLFTLAAAVLATASLWAADYTPAATAVYTVGDEATLGSQWKDVKQKANYFEVGDTIVMSPYVVYQSAADNYQSWTGHVGGGSTSKTWDALGCFQSSDAMFTDGSKAATVNSSRTYFYNVTNCIAFLIYANSENNKGERVISVNAFEIADGVVGTEAVAGTTYAEKANGIAKIEGLDKAKKYQIQITSNNGSNSTLYEIAFVGEKNTDPKLSVNPEAVNLAVTAAEPTVSAKVTFSGKYLTPGDYSLTVPEVEGLTVTPASVTVAEDGKLNAEVTVAYTSEVEVAAATAELGLTIGELSSKVTLNYSATLEKTFITSSLNIEQLVLDNGTNYDIKAALTAAGWEYENLSTLDSLNDDKTARNEPYLGLKLKTSGAYLAGWLKATDVLLVKFGNLGKNDAEGINVYINGTENKLTHEALVNTERVLSFAYETDTYIKIVAPNANTYVFKQLMLNEDIAEVTLPASPETTAIDNTDAAVKATKRVINGVLFIEKNGVLYNAQGAVVK